MTDLGKKIEDATELLRKLLNLYKNPVVMSSFGKDSMVMLDLVKRMGRKLPILFHHEPFFPKKLEFANSVILREGYTVYDYAPSETSIVKAHGVMEIVNWYSVGKKFTYLPTGVKEPLPGEPYLCGLRDLYHKPTSSNFTFPWDLVLVGHKSSDVDPIQLDVLLKVDLKKNEGGPDYGFPLRHFTDEDVYQYHMEFKLPWNRYRYIKNDLPNVRKFEEFKSVTYNNDYYPACTRCMDPDGPASVICPLINKEISNISKELRHTVVEKPDYIQ
jgi:hypothetical protein